MLRKSAGLVLFLLVISGATLAQTFTSTQAGPWDVAATWGGAGVPTAANSTSIVVNHAVTVPAGYTASIDQTTVNGSIIVSASAVLDVANGTGNDLTLTGSGALDVTGRLDKEDLAVIIGTTAANTNFRSGSVYRHLNTASEGAVPLATWDANSTLEIAAWTAGKTITSNTWSQAFGHVVYNCPSQVAIIYFNGLLTNIQGNLTIQNTNSVPLQLVTGQTVTITIGGDLSVSGSSRFHITTIGNPTVNIGGSFIFNSTNATDSYICTSGNTTLNIGRDFSMNAPGGLLTGGAGNPSSGLATLNVSRDFTLTAGTFRENGNSSQTVINFTNSAPHIFTNSGNIIGTFDYFVGVNDIVTIPDNSYFIGINGTGVTSDMTLNGTLILQSTNSLGALVSANSGNVRTPVATRTYSPGSTIVYGATTGMQYFGESHPTSPDVNTIINNTDNVGYASTVFNVSITGTLTLQAGRLVVSTTSSPRTLTLSGPVSISGGLFSFSGPSSNMVITGTGTASLAFDPSAQTVNNFTLNRATGATLSSAMTINNTGTLSLTSGDLTFSGQTLTINGTSSVSSGRLASSATSALVIGGSGAFGTLPPFAPGNDILGTLTLNRSTSGTATINSPITISSNLNLTLGTLTNTSGLTMGNGSGIVRASVGSLIGNRPTNAAGHSYNVTYSGSTTSTGLELPLGSDPDDLGSLTINGGPITLTQSIIINGSLNLNSGNLNVGSNQITMEGSNWNDNAGNIVWGANPVIFNGALTTINGSTIPTFSNVQVNGGAAILFSRNSVISLNLVVNSGGAITLPTTTLTVSRDVTIQSGANVTGNNGTLLLNGNVLQNVSANGATFHHITVNKPSGLDVALTSNLSITGVLDVQSANSDVASNGFLTLASLSDGPTLNGSIAALLNNATVSGDVTVQRYQSAEGPVNRYISTPVSNARVIDLQDDFSITGLFSGSSYPCTGCLNNGYSLKHYLEPTPGPFNKGYQGYPLSGSSNLAPLVVGTGYLAYMWNGAAQVTWDLTGPINRGPISFNITSTPSSPPDPNADGWNLIGNPYPSSIDWDNATGWTKTNMAPAIYVWDDAAAVFRTWNGTTGDLSNGVIATGQSFWVYANNGSAALSIDEPAKTSAAGAFYRKPQFTYATLAFSITEGDRTDNSFLLITPDEDPETENLNARKLDGENLGISLLDEKGTKWVMYAQREISEDAVYPLSVVSEAGKVYTLSFVGKGGFNLTGWKLYDRAEEVYVNLSKTSTYTFTGSAEDPSRFFLIRGEIGAGEDISSVISIFPNPATEKVSVTWTGLKEARLNFLNSVGTQMTAAYTLAPQQTVELDIQGWQRGMYVVQIAGEGKLLTRKIIKK